MSMRERGGGAGNKTHNDFHTHQANFLPQSYKLCPNSRFHKYHPFNPNKQYTVGKILLLQDI